MIRIDEIWSYEKYWKIIGEYVPSIDGTVICKRFLCITDEKSKCGNSGSREIAVGVQKRVGKFQTTVNNEFELEIFDSWIVKQLKTISRWLYETTRKPKKIELSYPLYSYAHSYENFLLFPKGNITFERNNEYIDLIYNDKFIERKHSLYFILLAKTTIQNY